MLGPMHVMDDVLNLNPVRLLSWYFPLEKGMGKGEVLGSNWESKGDIYGGGGCPSGI